MVVVFVQRKFRKLLSRTQQYLRQNKLPFVIKANGAWYKTVFVVIVLFCHSIVI